MAGRSIEYRNFTGGLNNVSSIGTINQTPNGTESPDLLNIEYFKLGGIKSMDGNYQIGDTQVDEDSNPISIIGGWEYIQNGTRYMIIATSDNNVKIYNSTTNVFDIIYTFPSSSERVSFVNLNNGVVFSNGVDDLVFYEYGRDTLLSGTISTSIGSATVTGVATKFTTELSVGDHFIVDTLIYVVKTITSDTSLTITTNATTLISGHTYNLTPISECNAYLVNTDDVNLYTPIRGLAIQLWKGRLFVGDTSGIVYFSELGYYNRWDVKYDAGAISDAYNDSSGVKALGLFSTYLVVHKEFFTYLLTGTDSVSENWVLSPYCSISCDSQQSFVVSNAIYYVFSKENLGIYPLTQITVFGDKYVGKEISVKIRNMFNNLRIDEVDKIFAVRNPQKRQLMMYMPFNDQIGSNTAVIFDFQTKSWLLRQVPQEVTIAFEYNNQVYIGTADGLVLQEFTGSTFNGQFINAYYKTPWLSLGASNYFKSVGEFTIQMEEDASNVFEVRVYRDGNSPYTIRDIDNSTGDTTALIWEGIVDTATNITTWDNYNWIQSGFISPRFPLEQTFAQNLQLQFSTVELGQSFAIYGFGLRRIEYEETPW